MIDQMSYLQEYFGDESKLHLIHPDWAELKHEMLFAVLELPDPLRGQRMCYCPNCPNCPAHP